MAKPKIDGVIEAVRYKPDGQILWVRAYLRRGSTYSDRILLDRQELIELLKSGKSFVSGARVELMASTFQVGQAGAPAREQRTRRSWSRMRLKAARIAWKVYHSSKPETGSRSISKKYTNRYLAG